MASGARRAFDPLALVAKAYESALSPRPFAELLPEITAALAADGAIIALYAPELGQGDVPVAHEVPESAQRRYREHYWKIDPWRIRYQSRRLARAVSGADLIPFRDLANHEIYSDHLRDAGFVDTCCAEFYRSGSAGGAISILRVRGRPFFGRAETRQLDLVLPHLARAFALHRRFSDLIAERTEFARVIDRYRGGAILCDRHGRVLYATDEARRILAVGTALYMAQGRARARDPAANQTLAGVFEGNVSMAAAGSTFVARDRNGGEALRVSIVRAVPGTILDPLQRTVAFYLLIDVKERLQHDPVDQLTLERRLTPAETRLARCLASGATLRDAAEQLGVSIHTVRSQLRQIFAKTGTSRQAALMRLLLSPPL